MMASCSDLRVTVRGKGGHGSAPHRANDPIPAACEMVTALSTAVIALVVAGVLFSESMRVRADAQLEQARENYENLRAQVDTDVRTALLNLQSSSEQVAVAKSNIDLAQQTLDQSRDRFAAGVADTVEVVQAQEQVASANDSYIASLYSYNYAKISLARAMVLAEVGVKEYFKGN